MSCDDPNHAHLHAELEAARRQVANWERKETMRGSCCAENERRLGVLALSAIAVAKLRPHDGSQLDEELEGLLLEARKYMEP